MALIYVTPATFLTQLKKLYKNIKIIRASLSSKKSLSCVDKNIKQSTTYKKFSIIVLKKVPSLKTLKKLWFIQPIKESAKRKNQTINPLAFCLIYLKFTNDFYMTKCILISVIFFLNINVAFVRDIVTNTASQQ